LERPNCIGDGEPTIAAIQSPGEAAAPTAVPAACSGA
jgi:hypothetical protein